MLPHQYPFIFIDPVSQPSPGLEGCGSVVARVTQGAGPLRGTPELPPVLAIEMIAQASAVLSGGPAAADGPKNVSEPEAAEPVHLAGFEATFSECLATDPMIAGDELEVRLEDSRGFGGLRKISGRLLRIQADGNRELLVEAELMLTK